MKRKDVVQSARLAGCVKRYHTWPTLTTQTVAEHTWHVMRIWWALFGPPSREVTTYLLWHDAGELATGDVPYPVKKDEPEVGAIFCRIEKEAVRKMGGPYDAALGLSERDRQRAKICDLLEMYEFGLQEARMGNSYAEPIVDAVKTDLIERVKKLTLEDADRVAWYLKVD